MFKLPKKYEAAARTIIDPLGLGIDDALFGSPDGPDFSKYTEEQQQALKNLYAEAQEFEDAGPAQYETGEDLEFQELGPGEMLADSALNDIRTDPKYKEYELAALRELEQQSQNGFTAADRADMVRTESSVNRANRGRMGAIQQRMQSSGRGGTEMDALMQMQSAQDAHEIEALRAIERDAQSQTRKTNATMGLGNMAGSLQARDFSQEARKAEAADSIARFNNQYTNEVERYNNQGNNTVTAQNWGRDNQVSDANASADYQHRQNVFGNHRDTTALQYNNSVENENRQRLDEQAARERAGGQMGTLLGVAGGVIGGAYGGPAGAGAGYQIGSGTGRQVGSNAYDNRQGYAYGGRVEGEAIHPGDHPENDVIEALVSPDEIIIPRSISDDPQAAADFVAEENGQENDVVGLLLQAMQKINKGER